jgi:hypothetical protein
VLGPKFEATVSFKDSPCQEECPVRENVTSEDRYRGDEGLKGGYKEDTYVCIRG